VRHAIQQLEGDLLALGSLVEDLLIESVDLLKRSDLRTLERLGQAEREASRKRLAIEMGCLSLIAGRRPVKHELRSLVAMVEIAGELGRVGDHAERIGRANVLGVDHRLRKPLAGVHSLSTTVQSLLHQALQAFSDQDLGSARAILVEVREMDIQYHQVHEQLLAAMKSRPRIANQAIHLLRAAYHVKRAAERVTGICEWVGFTVNGWLGLPATVLSADGAPQPRLTVTS
jgi:phosphate transport system protein